MNQAQSHFIQPLDVLFLRGNKLFGAAGSYGEALVPPWPSLAAGALRSALLATDGTDIPAFARGEIEHAALGTPRVPGAFTVEAFQLARCVGDRIEPLYPLPADLSAIEEQTPRQEHQAPRYQLRRINPQAPTVGLQSSYPLPMLPTLAETQRGKPTGGLWLSSTGIAAWLSGDTPPSETLLKTDALWSHDPRIGIGLNATTGAVEEGHLFTMQAVAMRADTGFVTRIAGATLPERLALRLGGDGRAATAQQHDIRWPEADLATIAADRRMRLLLTSPGLFEHGWLPTGTQPDQRRDDGAMRFTLHGVTGYLVCAAVPRAEVISGWDLAAAKPKPAHHAAPASSVYWIELDDTTEPATIGKLAECGLWPEGQHDDSRRAEGFNRCLPAVWSLA